mmetsp:Transcript_63869/g.101512  ORF Transcript_63869/g.101512 Transcript_63869/m.101512 type:complete len:208 (-) Transcript_63869:604-1227(-)
MPRHPAHGRFGDQGPPEEEREIIRSTEQAFPTTELYGLSIALLGGLLLLRQVFKLRRLMGVGPRAYHIVRVQGQGVHPVTVALQLIQHGSILWVPYLDDAVPSSAVDHPSQVRPLAGPADLHHRLRVRGEAAQAHPHGGIPNSDCRVFGAGGQQWEAVTFRNMQGLPTQTCHGLRVAAQSAQVLAALGTPNQNDLVHPSRGKSGAVR